MLTLFVIKIDRNRIIVSAELERLVLIALLTVEDVMQKQAREQQHQIQNDEADLRNDE